MKYVYVACILLFATLASAYDLTLKRSNGKQVSEISGLAILGDYLLLLPQREKLLYAVPVKDVISSIESGGDVLTIEDIKFSKPSESWPDLKNDSGWEAVEVLRLGNELNVILAHEDEDGNHAIYIAKVKNATQSGDGLQFGQIEKHIELDKVESNNYSYEALIVSGNDILAIPELTEGRNHAVIVGANKEKSSIQVTPHEYRLSDATRHGQSSSHFLATSFCHKTDKEKCRLAHNDGPVGRLICLENRASAVTIVGSIELPVYVDSDDTEFNSEGLVTIYQGVLLANDNIPGHAPSRLRYLTHPKVLAFVYLCQ